MVSQCINNKYSINSVVIVIRDDIKVNQSWVKQNYYFLTTVRYVQINKLLVPLNKGQFI